MSHVLFFIEANKYHIYEKSELKIQLYLLKKTIYKSGRRKEGLLCCIVTGPGNHQFKVLKSQSTKKELFSNKWSVVS